MCKYCVAKGLTQDEIDDFHDGEFEQRQAYLERLAADFSEEELAEEQERLSKDVFLGDSEFHDSEYDLEDDEYEWED